MESWYNWKAKAYMKTNIFTDFQVCIIVPLKQFQWECEVCDLCSCTEMLINPDMLASRF